MQARVWLLVLTLCWSMAATPALAQPASHSFDSASAEHLVGIPIPRGAQLRSIGNGVEHNGTMLSLATFESPEPLAQTRDFYRELWGAQAPTAGAGNSSVNSDPSMSDREAPRMVENRVDSWLVLGHLQAGYQRVLQLNLDLPDRSSGYLSVMQLADGVADMPAELAIAGLELLSTTRSLDIEKVSRLSVYRAAIPSEALSRQLETIWQERGWSLLSNQGQAHSRVLLFNRRNAQLDIVISPGDTGGSVVIMNEVQLDG